MAMPKLNIVGCGHVGRVFARLFAQHQVFQVQDILNRNQGSSAHALLFVGVGRALESLHDLRAARVWLLGVNDDQILPLAQALWAAHKLRPGDIVFHLSGAMPAAALHSLQQHGVLVASVHPIRSFADPARVLADFAGTCCTLEGDAKALQLLQDALQRIGARVLPIDGSKKAQYHAASVFACNYLNTLFEVALQNWEAAGISRAQAQEFAAPLVRETLENILRLGPAPALSGPLARGDMQTVARHQQALQASNPQHAALYDAFIPLTQQLAEQKRAASKTD